MRYFVEELSSLLFIVGTVGTLRLVLAPFVFARYNIILCNPKAMPECSRLKSSLCPCPMHMQLKSRQDIMTALYRSINNECVLFSNKNKMRFHNKYKASKLHTCN